MSNSRQKGTKLGTCAPDQVYQVLQTSPQGLNSQEVKKRQATYGPNQLKESKKEPIWLTFFRHFTSLMALLLWVGGFTHYRNYRADKKRNDKDSIVIQ